MNFETQRGNDGGQGDFSGQSCGYTIVWDSGFGLLFGTILAASE